MNDSMIVEIEGKKVEQIRYKDQPVITFRMVDELHERPEGTAKRAFNYHKDKLIENEDFFDVPYEEWSEIIAVRNSYGDSKQRNSIKFLAESGYLMLVKTFNDEQAWKIQRALVRNYFVAKELLRGNSADYIPELKAFLKEATSLIGTVRDELHCFREEINKVRQERDFFRDRLFVLQDHLIAKGTAHPEPSVSGESAVSSETDKEYEILKSFVAAWWKEYGDDRVGVSHLYPLPEKHNIPLNLGGGTERSRTIRLGRKLTAICGQKFGDYIVTEAKAWRNVKRYRLKLAGV